MGPTMKTSPSTFGNVGGPIVCQVTLGSFSAPPVPGDLKNDLRVTWDTLGPPKRAKDPPAPESQKYSAIYFFKKMMRPWRSAGKFWHHEVTALSNTPSSRQLSKLKNQRPKGEGFQRENRRVPTL